jgi:hypothetical protein
MILFYLGALWFLATVACLIVDLKKAEARKPKDSPSFWVGLGGASAIVILLFLMCSYTNKIPESKYILQVDTKMTLQNSQLQVLPQTTDTNIFRLAVQTPNGFEYLNQTVNSVVFEGDNIILEKIEKRLNWGWFNYGVVISYYNLILPIRTVKPW